MGKSTTALRLAAQAAERSRDKTSMPDWVAGLAAFRLKRYQQAAKHFGLHSKSEHAGEWNASAGAFWAARAEARRGRSGAEREWLEIAAKYPFTFYGQLALGRLGKAIPAGKAAPPLQPSDIAEIQALSGGNRMLALVQVGQVRLADEELMQHLGSAPMPVVRAITAVAQAAGLTQSAMRGAFRIAHAEDQPSLHALYPMPNWQPSGGFAVDRALIWAFVRQESVFNPRATSVAGARGLMQLMPSTANYVAGRDRFQGPQRDKLYEPTLNLSLGQQYLQYLMGKDIVGDNLFRLAVAYNAGVGNLATWSRDGLLADDPLMFIEILPLLETRLFVERVIANYWIYRGLMGQARPSMTALLRGQWPRYRNQDRALVEIAEGASYAYR